MKTRNENQKVKLKAR